MPAMYQPPATSFFPGLHYVRGIAAMLVMLNHIAAKKTFFPALHTSCLDRLFSHSGVFGLTLFFCLSGFLITHQLLTEQQQTGTIQIIPFYKRRMYRIWPLYYIIILLGHFLIPFLMPSNFEGGDIHTNFVTIAVLYLLFLPNYVLFIFKPHNPYTDITWSIGVEEQFYLVWPWLIKAVKRLPVLLVALVLLQLTTEISTWFLTFYTTAQPVFYLNKLLRAIEWTRCGYFALGALAAYLYHHPTNNKLFNTLLSKMHLIFLIVGLLVWFHPFPGGYLLLGLVYSVFQLKIIRWQPLNPNKIVTAILNIWGTTSYGMYLWHCIIIVLVFKSIAQFDRAATIVQVPVVGDVLLYGLIIGLTMLISYMSYTWIEQPMIQWGKRKLNTARQA